MRVDTMMTAVEGELSEPEANARARGADLDTLFRDESDAVYRTLYAFTGGRGDVAEEATAEAFARAIAHGDELRDPLAWIYRVAFRVAIDDLRREGREARRAPAGTVDADPTATPPELLGLLDALQRLSPNQRAAIVLHHVLGLETGEVAHRMGITAPTVRVHLHRGRRRLRELLGTEEVE